MDGVMNKTQLQQSNREMKRNERRQKRKKK